MNGIGMVVAYRDDGTICGTLDYRVLYDETKPDRPPLGMVDFAAHEAAGGEMLDVWKLAGQAGATVSVPWTAKGSKVWPEWLGREIYDFTVELEGPAGQKRISALVHKTSGYRRERAVLEAAIQARLDEKTLEAAAAGDALRAEIGSQELAAGLPESDQVASVIPDPTPEPADIRDLVGGPNRPLLLDADGRTVVRPSLPAPSLPLIPLTSQPGAEPPVDPAIPL